MISVCESLLIVFISHSHLSFKSVLIAQHLPAPLTRLLFPQYFPLTGGAFHVGPGGRLSLNRTRLEGIFNADTGGIIYLDAGARAVLQSCSLGSGRAISSGGAVFVGQRATLVLIDTIVENSSAAQGSGGGVYLASQAKLFAFATPLGGCAFRGNSVASATGRWA